MENRLMDMEERGEESEIYVKSNMETLFIHDGIFSSVQLPSHVQLFVTL